MCHFGLAKCLCHPQPSARGSEADGPGEHACFLGAHIIPAWQMGRGPGDSLPQSSLARSATQTWAPHAAAASAPSAHSLSWAGIRVAPRLLRGTQASVSVISPLGMKCV